MALADVAFDAHDLLARLDGAPLDAIDEARFGLIVMDRTGRVIGYNTFEAEFSGLDPARVVGRHFFVEVGPCTLNRRVSERFDTAQLLDETIDFVFTYRMSPTPVRLRMLAAAGAARQYLVVEKR